MSDLSWRSPTWLRYASVVWGVLGGALCAILVRKGVPVAIDYAAYHRPWAQAVFAPEVALAAAAGGLYCTASLLSIVRGARRPSVLLWAFPLVGAVPLPALLVLYQAWTELGRRGLVARLDWGVLKRLLELGLGMLWAIPLGVVSGVVFYALAKPAGRSRPPNCAG